MTRIDARADTKDGPMAVSLFVPEGTGPWPAVVLVIDGFGPREAIFEVAARHAAAGFVVSVHDAFHRAGSVLELAPPGVEREVKALFPVIFGNPELRARWRERFYASATDPAHVETDVGAVLDLLASRPEVRRGKVGIIGYCMGGGIALRAAAQLGPKIGAAASFHGGMLATDADTSPHREAPRIRAAVLVVGAIEDPSFDDASKARLAEALTAADVRHTIETYPARHGFCIPDAPTYDPAQRERHHGAAAAFFHEHLG